MDELPFKIVRVHGAKDEVIARVENIWFAKRPSRRRCLSIRMRHLEMRQAARIILKWAERIADTTLLTLR
jgi:hypothetical protein